MRRIRPVVALIILFVIAAVAVPLSAQSTAAGTAARNRPPPAGQPAATASDAPSAAPSKWELEMHGGLSLDPDQTGGIATLPSTGTTVQGTVSLATFAFGTGTALFNQARNAIQPIVPLDATLSSALATRPAGLALGGRIQRRITRRVAVEASGDYLRATMAFRPSALSGIETTRASVEAGLQQTFAATPYSASVSSVTTITDNQLATRLVATGTVVFEPGRSVRTVPYFVGGGGVMVTQQTALAASLNTEYQLGTTSYLVGADRVWIRVREDDRSPVGVAGGGLKRVLSRHAGLRFDARVHVYRNTMITLVDVTPALGVASREPALPRVDIGPLQFSAIAPLTAGSLLQQTTFADSRWQMNSALTAGLYFRF